jgi:hypothetical protein
LVAWRWQSGVQSLAPLDRTAACVASPLWRIDSKCWEGLCGSNPSWHSRSAYRRALAVQPFGYLQSRTCRPQGNKLAGFLVGPTGHGDLGYGGPVPDSRLADSWGTILAIALAGSEGSEPEQLSMRVTVTPEQAFSATIKAMSVG